jgi:hypothetical protein
MCDFSGVMTATRIARLCIVRRFIVLGLLRLMADADTETSGLSKGPLNPADIGSRCAVTAGREDRAYLHCSEQAQRPAAPPREDVGTSSRLQRLEHSRDSYDGAARRFPLRRR